MAQLTSLLDAYLVLVALMLGSFINLASDRLPRGESLVTPASHCRGCGRRLNAVDLLPVLGYVVRGGRCASCRTPIGVSAPIVEAVAGVLMLGAVLLGGAWPGGLVGLLLVTGFGVAVTKAARSRAAGENAPG